MAAGQLQRLLGKGFAIAACVGLVIGLGILRTPGEIAASVLAEIIGTLREPGR